MTQRERDRLVVLKKAKEKLITQAQAAEEIGVTERQVRRLLRAWKKRGDRAVIHALKGRVSNRRMEDDKRDEIVRILSDDVYHGFGPTLASEYLRRRHGIDIGREALRLWMAKPDSGVRGAGRRTKLTCGGNAGAVSANWSSGTPPITTGSRGVAAAFT
jgi:hypothetical protein